MSDGPVKGAEIGDVEALLAGFIVARNEQLDIAAMGFPSKLPFKAVSLRELLIHRVADLSYGALESYRCGMVVPAILLTRAVVETAALIFALHTLVLDVVTRKSLIADDDSRLMKMLFGRRDGLPGETATNILTRIDQLDQSYKGYRWWYDKLSEVAHPNHDGLLGSYGVIHKEEFLLDLGVNDSIRGFANKVGLPALMCSLEIAAHYCNELSQTLPEFREICHDAQPPNEAALGEGESVETIPQPPDPK